MAKNPPSNTGDVGSDGKELACSAGETGSIPELEGSPGGGHGKPLQCLAWKIPWTAEPGGLQPMGSKRVRRDLATKPTAMHIYTYMNIHVTESLCYTLKLTGYCKSNILQYTIF